jgi:hypothetical protein
VAGSGEVGILSEGAEEAAACGRSHPTVRVDETSFWRSNKCVASLEHLTSN